MMILAINFVSAVLTAYTLYRFIIIQNDYLGELALVHANWYTYCMYFTTMILFAGSTVEWKVQKTSTETNCNRNSNHHQKWRSHKKNCFHRFCVFPFCLHLFLSKGKQVAVICHRIINRSANKHICSAVIMKNLLLVQEECAIQMFRNKNSIPFQLQQLSQQVQARSPYASCGLFVVDWTLLFTVSWQ